MKNIVILLLIFFTANLFAQKNTDSLEKVLVNQLDTNRVNTLIELCKAYHVNNSAKAIEYGLEAIKISENQSFTKGLLVAHNTLANVYLHLGNYAVATENYQKSLEFTELMHDKHQKANVLTNIGVVYYYQANYPKALEFYFASLKLKEELKLDKGIALTLNNIGTVYYDLKNYEKAKEYHTKALEIRTKIKDTKGTAESYNNLGLVAKIQNDYNKSLNYFEKSLSIKQRLKEIKGIAITLNNIGTVYECLKDYDKAFKVYNESYEIRTKIKDNEGLAAVLTNLANIHLLKNELARAEESALKSLEISTEIKANDRVKNAYLMLSEIAAAQKNFAKAYKYHLSFTEMNEKLFNETKSKQITEMQVQYETEKKAQEIAYLKLEKASLMRIRNLAIVGMVLLIALIILLINRYKLRYKLFRQKEQLLISENEKSQLESERLNALQLLKDEENRRLQEQIRVENELNLLKNEKLQADIDFKHRELTSSTMLIAQKNQILAGIKEQIEKINITDKQLKSQINGIMKQITDNIELDDDWKTFKLHFDNVHPDFFDKLLNQFPTLTQNEQKHCAYICMNLSVKEVGRLLGVNSESVQMTRYRLKKKMDLPAEVNLNDFIANL